MATKRWMLPDGMEEGLPPVSWQLERLRRRLLVGHAGDIGIAIQPVAPQIVQPEAVKHEAWDLVGFAEEHRARADRAHDPRWQLVPARRACGGWRIAGWRETR